MTDEIRSEMLDSLRVSSTVDN